MMSENQNIEYKATWRDEYLQWLCGFANARGGTIYVGINDGGETVGLRNADRLLEDIPNKVVAVLGISAYVMLHTAANGLQYLEISVEPQAFPVSCKGLYYQRSGATNQLLKGTALDTFLLRKQGRSWDGIPTPYARMDDLSVEAIRFFVSRAQAVGRASSDIAEERPRALLERLHLIQDERPTSAAVLLFHPEPEAFFPGATVKLGFFEGPEILYQDVIGGPIIQQVDKTLDLLYTKYLKAKISYVGAQRIERYPFPRDAVREAIINAIAHKDYASGAPIQIRVYEDRLRIGNSCILPEGWTLDDLLGVHESLPHNPKIANVFFLAGYVESWGRGVQKVFAACKLDGIQPPEYQMAGNSLLVVFTAPADRLVKTSSNADVPVNVPVKMASIPRDPTDTIRTSWPQLAAVGRSWPQLAAVWDTLDNRERNVLSYLAEHGSSKPAAMSDALDIPMRTLRRVTGRLMELGLVDATGQNKSRTYALRPREKKGQGH